MTTALDIYLEKVSAQTPVTNNDLPLVGALVKESEQFADTAAQAMEQATALAEQAEYFHKMSEDAKAAAFDIVEASGIDKESFAVSGLLAGLAGAGGLGAAAMKAWNKVKKANLQEKAFEAAKKKGARVDKLDADNRMLHSKEKLQKSFDDLKNTSGNQKTTIEGQKKDLYDGKKKYESLEAANKNWKIGAGGAGLLATGSILNNNRGGGQGGGGQGGGGRMLLL